MTPQRVYELQADHRAAEASLSNVAARLADAERAAQSRGLVVLTQPHESPEYRQAERAVEQALATMRTAQAEIGGVVYRVHEEKIEHLTKRVAQIDKRAQKLGVGTATLTDTGVEEFEEEDGVGDLYRYFVLNGTEPKLAGWRLLASIEHLDAGALIKTVPAFAFAWSSYRLGLTTEVPNSAYAREGDDPTLTQAKVEIEAMDFSRFRDSGPVCEHCNKVRSRKNTVIVQSVETGEVKQVGKSCLKDFLGGNDPHSIAKLAEWFEELDEDLRASGSGTRRSYSPLFYLTHVATMVRTEGWESRSAGGYGSATADRAWHNISAERRQEKDGRGQPMWIEPTEEDEAKAQAALEWAREFLHPDAAMLDNRRLSDFEHNMHVVARNETVPAKGDGILAYVIVAHAKHQERELERKRIEKVGANSEHVGTVGERMKLSLTVERVWEHAGHYGVTYITKLSDEAGNIFKWFGSREFSQGNRVEATWMVKEHGEWKGTKETVLTRPTKVTEWMAMRCQDCGAVSEFDWDQWDIYSGANKCPECGGSNLVDPKVEQADMAAAK